MFSEIMDRILRARRRHGLAALPVRAMRGLFQLFFRNKNIVFVHEGVPCDYVLPFDQEIRSFSRFEDLSADITGQIASEEGFSHLDVIREQMAMSSTLWIMFHDNEVVGYSFSRRGQNIGKWYVKIDKNDVVISGTSVFPRWRGKNVNPALMAKILKSVQSTKNKVYLDIAEYNQSALRSINKTNFKKIAAKRRMRKCKRHRH